MSLWVPFDPATGKLLTNAWSDEARRRSAEVRRMAFEASHHALQASSKAQLDTFKELELGSEYREIALADPFLYHTYAEMAVHMAGEGNTKRALHWHNNAVQQHHLSMERCDQFGDDTGAAANKEAMIAHQQAVEAHKLARAAQKSANIATREEALQRGQQTRRQIRKG